MKKIFDEIRIPCVAKTSAGRLLPLWPLQLVQVVLGLMKSYTKRPHLRKSPYYLGVFPEFTGLFVPVDCCDVCSDNTILRVAEKIILLFVERIILLIFKFLALALSLTLNLPFCFCQSIIWATTPPLCTVSYFRG